MQAAKIPFSEAERVKRFLLERGMLDDRYLIDKDAGHIYFPVRKTTGIRKRFPDVAIVDRPLRISKRPRTMRELLEGKLTKREIALLKTAHDTVGEIAIIEVDEALRKKERLIAKALLESAPAIRTVLRKAEKHEGVFRTQKLKWLAGRRTKEALYKENGVLLRLDVEKVYFSPRLSSERKRVMRLVRPGEDILVMFSGCGPYPCVLGKNTEARHITGIEINPLAHRYAQENIVLNRLSNVEAVEGDVRKVMPKRKEEYDRILMPLPMGAEDFLDLALAAAKRGATVHFYDFLKEERIPKEAVDKIKAACKEAGKRCAIERHVRCGQFGPGIFRVCVDFSVQ